MERISSGDEIGQDAAAVSNHNELQSDDHAIGQERRQRDEVFGPLLELRLDGLRQREIEPLHANYEGGNEQNARHREDSADKLDLGLMSF